MASYSMNAPERPEAFKLVHAPGVWWEEPKSEADPDVITRRELLEEHSKFKLKPFLEKSLKAVENEQFEQAELLAWAEKNKNRKPSKNNEMLNKLMMISMLADSLKGEPGLLNRTKSSSQEVITIDTKETPIDLTKPPKTPAGKTALRNLQNDLAVYPATSIPASSEEVQKKLIYLLENLNHPVILIRGETGSGKSRLIPRQVARFFNYQKKVLVTQPLRTNTDFMVQSLQQEFSKPVSMDNGPNWDPDTYGWKNKGGGDGLSSSKKIVYATDGWFLNYLINDPHQITNYGAIIVDEVHERNQNIDFLLVMIRKFLERVKKMPLDSLSRQLNPIKFIIMSATPQLETLLGYFGWFNPAKLFLPGRACHLQQYTRPLPPKSKNQKRKDVLMNKVIIIIEEILNNIMTKTLTHFCNNKPAFNLKGQAMNGKDILIFMPNTSYIRKIHEILDAKIAEPGANPFKQLVVYDLYAGINRIARNQALQPLKDKNKVKVVLATNFVQTGITIEGIKFVIDTGLTYTAGFNQYDSRHLLHLTYIDNSDATQRAGRAGRVEDGIVYQMFNPSDLQEVQSSVLTNINQVDLILKAIKIMKLRVGEPIKALDSVFADLPNPMSINQLNTSIDKLKKENIIDSNGNLTSLAQCWAYTNLDLIQAKCLFYSRDVNKDEDLVTTKNLIRWVSFLKNIEGTSYGDWVYKDDLWNNPSYKSQYGYLFTLDNIYLKVYKSNPKSKDLSYRLFQNVAEDEKKITKYYEQLKKNPFCFINLEKGGAATSEEEEFLKIISKAFENHKNWIASITEPDGSTRYSILNSNERLKLTTKETLVTDPKKEGILALTLIQKQNQFEGTGAVTNPYWLFKIPYDLMPTEVKKRFSTTIKI